MNVTYAMQLICVPDRIESASGKRFLFVSLVAMPRFCGESNARAELASYSACVQSCGIAVDARLRDWPRRSRSEARKTFFIDDTPAAGELLACRTKVQDVADLWLDVFSGFDSSLRVMCQPRTLEGRIIRSFRSTSGDTSLRLQELHRLHAELTLGQARTDIENRKRESGRTLRMVAPLPVVPHQFWSAMTTTEPLDPPLADRSASRTNLSQEASRTIAPEPTKKPTLELGSVQIQRLKESRLRLQKLLKLPPTEDAIARGDSYDFHTRWCGVLASQTMARVFGVTRDYRIQLPSDFSLNRLDGGIRVRVGEGMQQDDNDPVPATCCIRAPLKRRANLTRLIPKPFQTAAHAPGTFPLDKERFHLTPENTYSDSEHLETVAAAQANLVNRESVEAGEDRGIPNAVTWGLALQQFAELPNVARTNSASECLYAEDLCIGYRFDVRKNACKEFASLCEREVRYRFAKGPLKDRQIQAYKETERYEEGVVERGGSLVNAPKSEDTVPPLDSTVSPLNNTVQLRLDEWFVWNDYPLCVPVPDGEVHNPGPSVDPHDAQRNGPIELPYKTEVLAKAGTQYPLRYGASYEVACREVYLGGLGLAAGEIDLIQNVDRRITVSGFMYRPEPVQPPQVVLAEPIDESGSGEQMNVLVVRSGPNARESDSKASRYVLAPKVDTHFASLHANTFDTMDTNDAPPSGAYGWMLLDQEGNVPSVEWVNRHFAGDYFEKLSPRKIDDALGKQRPSVRDNAILIQEGGHRKDRYYEYYPDPMARSIHFSMTKRDASCWGDEIRTFDLYPKKTWPYAGHMKIEVSASPASAPRCFADWKTKTFWVKKGALGTLAVDLMPGEDVVLKLWSGCCSEKQSARQLTRATAPSVYDFAKNERFFRLNNFEKLSLTFANPATELRLLHATQLPLRTPEFVLTGSKNLVVSCDRDSIGSSQALFKGGVKFNAPTTGSLRATATWTDLLDSRNGEPVAPYEVDRNGLGFEIPSIAASDPDVLMLSTAKDRKKTPLLMEFNDTRHHRIAITLSGTSRFSKWFPSLAEDKFVLTNDNSWTVDVSSSMRPPPPRPFYLVPLFETKEKAERRRVTASSRMVGYRLWIDPPVFDSGNHPHLAVVCMPRDHTPPWDKDDQLPASMEVKDGIPAAIEPYVSRIGEDPVWPGSNAYEWLPADVFNAPVTLREFKFPGQASDDGAMPVESDEQVAIAAFPITKDLYDETRGQYAIDLRFAEHTLSDIPREKPFLPFLRLALAIYQPHSLKGVELSPIVVADMMQIHPSRQLTCTKHPKRKGFYRLVLTGFGRPEFLANTKEPQRLQVSVILAAEAEGADLVTPIAARKLMSIEMRGREYVAVLDFDLTGFKKRPGRIKLVVREHWKVMKDTISRQSDLGPGDMDDYEYLPRSAIAMSFDV